MVKLQCITKTEHSQVTKVTCPRHARHREKLSCSRFSSEGEFQLTGPWSGKILGKVVEEVQNCSTSVP